MIGAGNLHVRAFRYSADALTTIEIIIYGIFIIIFLILAGLSVVVLFNLRGHRSPYVPLFLSLLLVFIQSIVVVALLLLQSNALGELPPGVLVGLIGLDVFTSFLSFPFLFVAFCDVLRDRFDAINATVNGAMGIVPFALVGAFRGVFGLLLVFGVTTAALATNYNHFIAFDRDVTTSNLSKVNIQIQKLYQNYKNLFYVFEAFLILSAFVVATFTIFVYRIMKRASINDRITKVLTFIGIPLYTLLAIVALSFTIVFSPVGVSEIDESEKANVADAVLANVAFAAVATLLVLLGLNHSSWNIHGSIAPQSSLVMQNWNEQSQNDPAYYTPSHMMYEPYSAETFDSEVNLTSSTRMKPLR